MVTQQTLSDRAACLTNYLIDLDRNPGCPDKEDSSSSKWPSAVLRAAAAAASMPPPACCSPSQLLVHVTTIRRILDVVSCLLAFICGYVLP